MIGLCYISSAIQDTNQALEFLLHFFFKGFLRNFQICNGTYICTIQHAQNHNVSSQFHIKLSLKTSSQGTNKALAVNNHLIICCHSNNIFCVYLGQYTHTHKVSILCTKVQKTVTVLMNIDTPVTLHSQLLIRSTLLKQLHGTHWRVSCSRRKVLHCSTENTQDHIGI